MVVNSQLEDAFNFCVEDSTGEPERRDGVAHHPTGLGFGVVKLHLMSEQTQVIRRSKTCRPGTDDQHTLTCRCTGGGQAPTTAQRLISKELFDGIDGDG